MYACHSVSVACRPAEKRRRRGEIGSIHRSILVGHRRPNRPQGVNPRKAKLFLLTFAAKGGVCCNPPWILIFPTEFLREIFNGYSFGVKESKSDR